MPNRTDIASVLIVGVGFACGPAAQASDPVPPHRATEGRIGECGVGWTNFRITYEAALQRDVIRIRDLGGTDEARLRCLRDAAARFSPGYLVEIQDPVQRRAYRNLVRAEEQRWARLWLKTLGSDKLIPRYDPRRGLKAFARGVETGCWIGAGRALEARGSTALVVRRRFLGKAMTPRVLNAVTCFRHMVDASNAGEHDIVLTFPRADTPGSGRR
jgi:hypothetical protein